MLPKGSRSASGAPRSPATFSTPTPGIARSVSSDPWKRGAMSRPFSAATPRRASNRSAAPSTGRGWAPGASGASPVRALELHRDQARAARRGAVAEFSDPHEEPVRRDRLSASWDPRPPTFPRDLPGEIVASAHARGSRIPAGAHPYRRARLAAGPGRTLVLWTTSGARDSISPIELAMECATADGIAVEVAEDRSDALR